jgi:CRP-like cAMP-binding protein
MLIKQADLFWDMDKDFITDLMKLAVKETHDAGSVLFKEGESAVWFFIMLKGRVRIDIGEDQQFFYIVSHAGEGFGWAGLIEMEKYGSSGTCLENTTLLKFDVRDIQHLVEDNPVNGMVFYKKLGFILGNHLLHSYHMDYFRLHEPNRESFGTGQMVLTDEMV